MCDNTSALCCKFRFFSPLVRKRAAARAARPAYPPTAGLRFRLIQTSWIRNHEHLSLSFCSSPACCVQEACCLVPFPRRSASFSAGHGRYPTHHTHHQFITQRASLRPSSFVSVLLACVDLRMCLWPDRHPLLDSVLHHCLRPPTPAQTTAPFDPSLPFPPTSTAPPRPLRPLM